MLFTAYFVRIQMQYHIERQITEEMQRVRDNSLLYVRQTLLLNDSRVDAAGFAQYREEIARQLKGAGYREVFLCDPDGELLAGEEDSFETRRAQEDFMQAQKQAGAFTVHYGSGGQCQVYFSMPVIWKEQPIGIISSTFDYGNCTGTAGYHQADDRDHRGGFPPDLSGDLVHGLPDPVAHPESQPCGKRDICPPYRRAAGQCDTGKAADAGEEGRDRRTVFK